MEIIRFKELLTRGIDVKFNIKDVFYSFTKAELNGEVRYFIGNENHTEHSSFSTVDELLNYPIDGETLEKNIASADGDDIPYSSDGRFYIRNVASDEHVSNAMLRLMLESGDPDAIKYKESYIQDLTFNSFIEYNARKGLHASSNKAFCKS